MRRRALGLAVLLVGLVSGDAAADCLDPTFGVNGQTLEPLGAATALARQADGRIVIAGQVGDFYHAHFRVARYDTNGVLDPAFGSGGAVETPFGGPDDKSQAFALALQADGKIVAVGATQPFVGPPGILGAARVALARYDAMGTLDATFGTGGLVTSTFPAATTAYGVVVQPDGLIAVAGTSASGPSGTDQFFFARYDAAGTLDPNFGTGGSVLLGSGQAKALVRQADGKLVAAGFQPVFPTNGVHHFALARVDADGVPDAGFGSGGLVDTDPTPSGGQQSDADALIVQDGKLVAGGFAYGRGLTLIRYDDAGTPDPTFGNAGIASAPPAVVALALAADADGNLVAAGTAYDGLHDNVAVARFTSDGVPDSTFGDGGVVVRDFDAGDDDVADAVLPEPDGTVVVAGYDGSFNAPSTILLARFTGDVCAPPCGPPECPAPPPPCTRADENLLRLVRAPTSERLVWKWSHPRGTGVNIADLGDPVSGGTSFDLQLLDEQDAGREITHWPYLSSGGTWTRIAYGFKYRWPDAGLLAILRAGPGAKARMLFKFKRPPGMLLPAMPLPPSVAIRLVRDGGPACWTSSFIADAIRANTDTRFDARFDTR